MNAIISGVKELLRTMYLGFFAMLPGVMFVGLLTLIASVVGIDYESNMTAIMFFGGACGGIWLSKKITLTKIEKISDQATKWDVYEEVKNN
jgi:hypothetical protein